MQSVKTEANERIEVLFRKAAPIEAPEARYPGFLPGTTVLRKGFVKKEGALSLPCDILFERDFGNGYKVFTFVYWAE